jgi:hypothetical protein
MQSGVFNIEHIHFIYLFVFYFNDAIISSDYTVSNDRFTNK